MRKIDFNQLKTDISLPDFLKEQLGWSFSEGSTFKNPKMESPSGDQTIVIKRNHQGFYTFFDVHNDKLKGSTILDLMQNEMYKESGKLPSLREVGEKLQEYIDSGKTILPKESKYHVNNELLDPDAILYMIKNSQPLTDISFLLGRGINKNVLESKEWKNVFFQKNHIQKDNAGNTKSYINTCVKLVNTNGVQGISQRNSFFKGCLGSRFDTIAASNIDKERPIDKLHIMESMIDGISHYQQKYFNSDLNLLYISSEGALTEGQINTIQTLVDKNKLRAIELNFDNDLAGVMYSLKLAGNLKFNSTNDVSLFSINKGVQDNDKNTYLNIGFNASSKEQGDLLLEKYIPLEILNKYFDNMNIERQVIFTNNSLQQYQLSFPTHKEMLKEIALNFIEQKFVNSVSLVQSVSKDYNQDLQDNIKIMKDNSLGKNEITL